MLTIDHRVPRPLSMPNHSLVSAYGKNRVGQAESGICCDNNVRSVPKGHRTVMDTLL